MMGLLRAGGVVLALSAALAYTEGCSDFVLNATSPSNILSGRTMDFAADLKTVIEVIPRGTTFQELPVYNCVDCPDYAWQSKYGFVAFNMFGLNVASDGLNERGLSAAWLYLDGTEYPTPPPPEARRAKDPHKPIITSVCTYLLGNYATVDEVRTGLETFQIAEFDERIEVPILHDTSLGRVPLHVSVHDAQGKSLVIEFLHGKTKVYDNVNEVLTNDPPLKDQLAALAENGWEEIPGGYGSTERFLRLSVLNHRAQERYTKAVTGASYTIGTEEQQGVSDVLHLLNAVVLPLLDRATEWSVVRDHGRKKLYVQSTQNQLLRMVDLNQLDFTSNASRHLVPVTFGDWTVDITKALKDPSSSARTMDLPPRTEIEKLLEKLLHDQGVPPAKAEVLVAKATINAAAVQGPMPGASSSPSNASTTSSFLLGALVGAVVAAAMMTFSQVALRLRRADYRPIA